MKVKYLCNDKSRDEQFISLLILGLMNALKEDLISCDDAWNWLLNVETLEILKSSKYSDDIIKAVHLGTEIENVKRIIPDEFGNSCDEIISIVTKILSKISYETDQIENLLEIIV